jgi:hypothetical protein
MRSMVYLFLCVCLLQCANRGNSVSKENAAGSSIACTPTNQEMNEMTFNDPNLLFSYSPDSVIKKYSILVLQVTQVINPQNIPVTIFISFSDSVTKWPVGNFSLYPADRPGEFRFRLTSAFEKIQTEKKSDKKNICLQLSLNKENIEAKEADKLKIYFGKPVFTGNFD